jgi:hypothetical protein
VKTIAKIKEKIIVKRGTKSIAKLHAKIQAKMNAKISEGVERSLCYQEIMATRSFYHSILP